MAFPMRWLFLSVWIGMSQGALADEQSLFVSVACMPKLVEIKFEGPTRKPVDAKRVVKMPQRWNTDDLRSIAAIGDSGDHFRTTPRPKTVACKISGVNVRVVVRPAFAPRWHPAGYCAVRTGAEVAVYRAGHLLLKDGMDFCTDDGDVPVSITVASSGRPIVVRMPALDVNNGF